MMRKWIKLQHANVFASALSWCLLFCSTACEQGEPTYLFILSGQSNMVRMNPAESFTPMVEKEFGKESVIVVKDAWGSQPIRRWYREWKPAKGSAPKPDGSLYDFLMKKVRMALGEKKATSITFVWMHGERDAKERHHEVYADSLKGLVQQLSEDLLSDSINVVIGRLSDARAGDVAWESIKQQQQEVCEANPRWEWVDTDDLDLNGEGNGAHYTKEGYRELGKRFAEKAIQLIKKE